MSSDTLAARDVFSESDESAVG